MKKEEQIKKLRFQPKTETVAARFTPEESEIIKRFCKKEKIQLSHLVRFALKQIVPNL